MGTHVVFYPIQSNRQLSILKERPFGRCLKKSQCNGELEESRSETRSWLELQQEQKRGKKGKEGQRRATRANKSNKGKQGQTRGADKCPKGKSSSSTLLWPSELGNLTTTTRGARLERRNISTKISTDLFQLQISKKSTRLVLSSRCNKADEKDKASGKEGQKSSQPTSYLAKPQRPKYAVTDHSKDCVSCC